MNSKFSVCCPVLTTLHSALHSLYIHTVTLCVFCCCNPVQLWDTVGSEVGIQAWHKQGLKLPPSFRSGEGPVFILFPTSLLFQYLLWNWVFRIAKRITVRDINKSNFNRNLYLGTTVYRVVRWLALVSVNCHPGIVSLSGNDLRSQKNSRYDKGVSDLPDICVACPTFVSRLELMVRGRPATQLLASVQRLGPNGNPWGSLWVQDRGEDAPLQYPRPPC